MPLIWDQIPLFEGTRRVLVGSTSQIFGLLCGANKCVGSERSGSIIHWRYVRRIQEWASKFFFIVGFEISGGCLTLNLNALLAPPGFPFTIHAWWVPSSVLQRIMLG